MEWPKLTGISSINALEKDVVTIKSDIAHLKDYQEKCERSHDLASTHRRKSDAEMISVSTTLKATLDAQTKSGATQEEILRTLQSFKNQVDDMAQYTPAMRRTNNKYIVFDTVKEWCGFVAGIAAGVTPVVAIGLAIYHFLIK